MVALYLITNVIKISSLYKIMKLISLFIFRFMEFFKQTTNYVTQNKHYICYCIRNMQWSFHYFTLYASTRILRFVCIYMQESTILLTPFLLRVTYVNHGTRYLIPFHSFKTPRLIPALKWVESINFLEDNATTTSRPLITSNSNSDPDEAKKCLPWKEI